MQQLWPVPAASLDDAGIRTLYAVDTEDRQAYLRTNFVSTLDGSAQGADGRSGTINTPTDQRMFALLRALSDLVLVGAETVRSEGYRAVELSDEQRQHRAAAGLHGVPTLAVVSRSLRIDPAVAADADAPVIVVTGAAGDDGALTEAGIEVLRCPGPGGVDLRRALHQLADRGLTRQLCEGGPSLHRQLLAEELLDEVCLTFVPRMVGGLGRRITDGQPFDARFTLGHLLLDEDGTLFSRWVRRPAGV